MRKKTVTRLRKEINKKYYYALRKCEMDKEALLWLYEYSILQDDYCLARYRQFARKANWYGRKEPICDTFIHKVDKESTELEKVQEIARKWPKTTIEVNDGEKVYRHYAICPADDKPEEEIRLTLAGIMAGRLKHYFKPRKRTFNGQEVWAYDLKIQWNDRDEIKK